MITIDKIWKDEWIVQWYQPLFIQILKGLDNHTNSTGDFTWHINSMLFPRQLVIN